MIILYIHVALYKINKFFLSKATDNKPKGMKCKPNTEAGDTIMPLSTYQYLNPSEFDEQCKPIDCHSQYTAILKYYN